MNTGTGTGDLLAIRPWPNHLNTLECSFPCKEGDNFYPAHFVFVRIE